MFASRDRTSILTFPVIASLIEFRGIFNLLLLRLLLLLLLLFLGCLLLLLKLLRLLAYLYHFDVFVVSLNE